MLYTNLNHIETKAEHAQIINENENVIIICGRMDHQSVNVYRLAEELKETFTSVNFFDLELDNPETDSILMFHEISKGEVFPLIISFKDGKMLNTSSGIQSKTHLTKILNTQFS